MSRDIINVQYPVLDETQSICAVGIAKDTVIAENGISIANAFANKNNTLMICVENVADADSTVTFVAGDTYPNAMLGNLDVTVGANAITVLQVQDMARFENKDGSINVDFADSFTGNVFVIAKSVDLNV